VARASAPRPVPGSLFVAAFRDITERAEITIDELLEFLESPTGRRLRSALAAGMIVSVPLIMRVPGLRRSAMGRLIETLGGAALVIKLAEVIRDWERGERSRRRRSVIDVPPAAS
jgi:hypothetical protein